MPNHPQQACWNCCHAVSPIPQFGLTVHVDTTSFAVHGQYASPGAAREVPAAALTTGADLPPAGEDLPAVIAVTYGYSRDHREDLKQWMQALATSGDGVPRFLQPLDGHASDQRALLQTVTALRQQLQERGETAGVYVADSGIYSSRDCSGESRVEQDEAGYTEREGRRACPVSPM